MSLPPGKDTGEEKHFGDQIIVFVEGAGRVDIESETDLATANRMIFVPFGSKHMVKNVGDMELKFFSVYSPPEYKKGWKE